MKAWLKGLAAAMISAGANSATTLIVDPDHFNFAEGFPKVVSIAGVSAVVGGLLYLKQSPLPGATT